MEVNYKSSNQILTPVLTIVALFLFGATATFAQTPTLRTNGKIAFTSDRDGNREIYVMNPDGTNQVRLTNNSVVDDHPTWSPDGTKIAFVSERPTGGFAICYMNPDGTNKTEITPINFDTRDAILNYWSMSWSPDGNRIVFQDDPLFFDRDILIVNIDGSDRHVLLNGGGDRQPSWSPDGSRILFSGFSTSVQNLFTVKPDGTDLRALAQADEEADVAPSWSPTGNMIAFESIDYNVDDNCTRIVIANPDGSNRQEFDKCGSLGNPDSGSRNKPQWSPDGSKIVFEVYGPLERGTQIYVKNVDGNGLTRLTNQPGSNFNPSWQPLLPTACPNPIDCADSFVRQHYRDFLNREPDAGGLAYWTNRITECGSDLRCIHDRRIGVSAAFFIEQEFQDTGYYVYRFYKATFGRQPTFNEFTADRAKVIGGANLEANKQAFADEWVQRPAFVAAYPITMSNTEVVNKLFDSAGLTSAHYDAQRQQEILAMNAGRSRASVLRDLIEIPDFKNIPDPNDPRYTELKQVSQYNPAFVLMQYFGYLRRDRDQAGYDFWLDVVNNREPNNYHGMVCSFITATEYQLRFGSVVTRSNADCGP